MGEGRSQSCLPRFGRGRVRARCQWTRESRNLLWTAQLAQVNFPPLPPSVVTLSQAQIAKIKG
jgi:hypothetical protein